MLHKFLNDFLALAPLQLPELINQERMEQPVYEDGYVLLDFKLEKPCPLEEVMNLLKTRWNWSSLPQGDFRTYRVRTVLLCLLQP